MKYFLLLFLAITTTFFIGCTEDENDWRYGDPQELTATEWINITPTYSENANESFSPIQLPKEQILSFKNGTFTMTTRGSLQNTMLRNEHDTIIISYGSYKYEHPMLWLILDDSGSSVEAWISPLNHICFYDNGYYNEFKRK